jgi:hypothetical protein
MKAFSGLQKTSIGKIRLRPVNQYRMVIDNIYQHCDEKQQGQPTNKIIFWFILFFIDIRHFAPPFFKFFKTWLFFTLPHKKRWVLIVQDELPTQKAAFLGIEKIRPTVKNIFDYTIKL